MRATAKLLVFAGFKSRNLNVCILKKNIRTKNANRVRAGFSSSPPQVSSPKELPLQTLSEPYVNLSTHTAPIVQPFLYKTPQWTKIFGCRLAICLNHFAAFR